MAKTCEFPGCDGEVLAAPPLDFFCHHCWEQACGREPAEATKLFMMAGFLKGVEVRLGQRIPSPPFLLLFCASHPTLGVDWRQLCRDELKAYELTQRDEFAELFEERD